MPVNRPKNKDDKFRLLFDDNPQPMWIIDTETLEFLEVNQAAIQHYGYSEQEFKCMKLSDIRPPEDIPRLKEFLSGEYPEVRNAGLWRHRLSNGRMVQVEVSVHSIHYPGRRALLAVLRDVTDRQLLEEQLRQSQKMEALGMLAGGIAHDFNNLLTIIGGYSQMLLNALPEDDPHRSSVEQILKAEERAAALTRQLLAFGRRQILQPKVLDLDGLVAGMGTMLRRLIGEDIDLRLVMGSELGRVRIDPGQAEQVIMNLVVNARDAMPTGGTLTIETRNVQLEEGYTSTHLAVKSGPFVMIAVSDTGVGMDAETRSHLFEPFFTTKGQGRGTGLGLSTVFGIVKQSGGNVEVYSEPGKGTSVKVYLPRVDRPASVEPTQETPQLPRGNETILLVEDEEMVRTLVRATLEGEGYNVLEAAEGTEARRICETYDSRIHLLITDIVMPKQSGRELSEQLAVLRPDMKVLFISGYTESSIITSGALTSGMPFLQKPFTPLALGLKVREVLGSGNEKQTRCAGRH